MSVTADVLVVGLGPVGAALGCLLGRYGVRTLLVDRAAEILEAPRAIALDNEALRILQCAGLAPDAFETVVIPRVRMVSPQVGEFARFNTSGALDGHPKLVTFYQPDMERALRRLLAEHACVEVRTGVELLEFSQNARGVVAKVRDKTGAVVEVSARYVVGADGASSFVRQAIGQSFHGSTYAQDWLVVDVRSAPSPIDDVEFICDSERPTPHMVAPGGRQRWEFMLRPGETRAQMESLAAVQKLLAPWGSVESMTIERCATYRFHARVCARFSKGRVFLAGDAAHLTPPFAGQGLVAGLRDAANLAWKLAWAVRGRADERIVETYDTERRPHAMQMIYLARALGSLVMPRNAAFATVIHGAILGARQNSLVRRYLDEMGLKPQNRYRTGLFVPQGSRQSPLERGEWLPQEWLQRRDGTRILSDDVLGQGVSCVGFGFDPETRIDTQLRAELVGLGGRFVQIGAASGVLPPRREAYVPVEPGSAFSRAVEQGWVAIVRPDRIVLHDGPMRRTARVVREALACLGARTRTHAPLMESAQ